MTERMLVTGNELKDVCTHLKRNTVYFTAGMNSIYVPSLKRKYIDKSVCKPWNSESGLRELVTPGEAARFELKSAFPDIGRIGWPKGQVSLLDKRVPLHYTGPSEGDFVYIDLKGAYYQIYRCLWLDTTYPRGYYGRYPLREVADTLNVWKPARNAVIGICRSREITGIKGNRRFALQIRNRFLSPGLWATVQDILHWVASTAVEMGAIYIHTDGYLFHQPETGELLPFVGWLMDNGFRFEFRANGQGQVVSWNNYRVGAFRTKANKLGLETVSRSFSNVRNENHARWAKYWENCRRLVRA